VTSVDYFVHDAEADTPSQVIAAYIQAHTEPNDLVVDPFCRSAAAITTALELGRRAIATNLNPIQALKTRLALTPLPAREIGAALTRLGDSLKLDTPLRDHLRRLYRTRCRHCAAEVSASFFVWERDQDVPSEVSYHCAACNDAGLRECDEADLQTLKAIRPRGLHYWYVLDRVARQQDDEARQFATQLLEHYTPRNLYALSNLVLKVEDLFSDPDLLDFLRLALLHCLQGGSKLNAVPGEPAAPRTTRLQPPPRFAEHNVWTLFENAVSGLKRRPPVTAVTLAKAASHVVAPPLIDATAEQTEAARAFAGHMSVRQLCKELPPKSVACVLAHPPHPGRSRWALDYLWTGWLYGYEESAALWPLARRRTSAWPWYLRAMQATLSAVREKLKTEGHITFIGQAKPLAYCESLVLAGAAAQLRLEMALFHPQDGESATRPFAGQRGEYRLTWTVGTPTPPWPMAQEGLLQRIQSTALSSAEDTLANRGEPANFARLHCAIWQALAKQGLAQRLMTTEDLPSPLSSARQQVRKGLQAGLRRTLRLLPEDESGDSALWWLTQLPEAAPLSERVELAVREILQTSGPVELATLLSVVYARFPDVQTPDREWTLTCLRSYARQTPPGRWMLKDEEQPMQRQEARAQVIEQLLGLGSRVGYAVTTQHPHLDVLWSQKGRPAQGWTILDSTALSQLVRQPTDGVDPEMRRIAVVCEARQDLLRLRLARAPWLGQQLTAVSWRFVTDSDIRRWAAQEEVTLAGLDALIASDPLSLESRSQLKLI